MPKIWTKKGFKGSIQGALRGKSKLKARKMFRGGKTVKFLVLPFV